MYEFPLQLERYSIPMQRSNVDVKCGLLNLVLVFKMHAKTVAAVTFATKQAGMDLSAVHV